MYIGNTPFQGLVGGGNILDASIEGVDLSTSAIAARLGYTPVDPGAAVFTANPTISSGTANSIAYLNGSKVVTTGSALTFDGTNFVTTGSGTFSGLLNRIHAQGTDAYITNTTTGKSNTVMGFNDSGLTNGQGVPTGYSYYGNLQTYPIAFISSGYLTNTVSSTTHIWNTTGSEQMRLNSTGLGIGTNVPANKLDVRGVLGIGTASTTTLNSLTISSSNTGALNHSHTFQGIATGTNDDLLFNLSQGGGSYGSFVVRFNGSNLLYLTAGTLANSGNSYLLPNNNFGIGTTSPSAKLDVRGNSVSTTVMVGTYIYNENVTTGTQSGIGLFNYDNFGAKIYSARSGSSQGNLVFAINNGSGVGEANVVERARFTTTGNFGLGTSAPGGPLEIYRSLASTTTAQQMLIINTDYGSAIGTGFGGAIVFRGRTAGNLLNDNAQILGYNPDSGDNGYALGFFTRPNNASGMLERVTISRGGTLSVGTTLNSGYKGIFTTSSGGSVTDVLAVHNGSNYNGLNTGARLLFKLSNFEDAIEQNKFASIEGVGLSAYNEDTALVFRTQSNANRGSLPTEKMRLDYAGWLTFPNSSGFRNYGIKASGFGYSQGSYGALVIGSPVGGNNTTVCINVDPAGNSNGAFSGTGGEVMFRNGVSFLTPNAANTGYHLNVLSFTDGKVGINIQQPLHKLDVNGSLGVTELYGRTLRDTNSANIDLTEYTAANFIILEVFGSINPNSGGSSYIDPVHFYVYAGRGWNGSNLTNYIYVQHITPPARDIYPSGGGQTMIDAVWYNGTTESDAVNDGTTSYYVRLKASNYNTSYGSGFNVRVIRRA